MPLTPRDHQALIRTTPLQVPEPLPGAGAQRFIGRYEVEPTLRVGEENGPSPATDTSALLARIVALENRVTTVEAALEGFSITCNEDGTLSWAFDAIPPTP